jgi:hypothetical protein
MYITTFIYLCTESTTLSVPSCELGPPPHLPQARCALPPGTKVGGHTRLRVRGWGGGGFQFGRLVIHLTQDRSRYITEINTHVHILVLRYFLQRKSYYMCNVQRSRN